MCRALSALIALVSLVLAVGCRRGDSPATVAGSPAGAQAPATGSADAAAAVAPAPAAGVATAAAGEPAAGEPAAGQPAVGEPAAEEAPLTPCQRACSAASNRKQLEGFLRCERTEQTAGIDDCKAKVLAATDVARATCRRNCQQRGDKKR